MAIQLLPPYASVPISGYMRSEFKRRRDTYGMKYIGNSSYGTQGPDIPRMADYRGPMSSWIRVVSNGITNEHGTGFVLKGGDGFDASYGINGSKKSVIGYTHNGTPHVIDNDRVETLQKHRPIPGIESIEVDIRKDVYRLAFIKWKCYSVEQLNYMMPYMFTPYTTVLLEWGWNNYNPQSLIDISSIGTIAKFNDSGTKILDPGSGMIGSYMNPGLIEEGLRISEGRYDGMIGHIINFDFTFNSSEMCFNCTTEIASNSRFYFGLISGDIVAEQNELDIRNTAKALRSEFFTVTLQSVLEYYVSKTVDFGENLAKRDGRMSALDAEYVKIIQHRIFSPSAYARKLKANAASMFGSKMYLSFGLLVDILNANNTTAITPIAINITGQKIGAHPNLISCSDKFLIPNAAAPYFSSKTLSDSPNKGSGSEVPLTPVSSGRSQESDRLLKKVLSTNQRQNLDVIINHLQIEQKTKFVVGSTQFPSAENPYEGMLENIYLSFDFVKEQLTGTPDLRSFLKSICEMLNEQVPIWKLEVIDWENKLSIRDINYLNVEILTQKKESFGIDSGEPAIYMFDAFTQNSFLKEFGFNVKLSDAIANAVVNQVNNQVVSDKRGEGENTTGNVTNQSYIFPVINDSLLKQMPPAVPGSTESVPNTKRTQDVIEREAKIRQDLLESRNVELKSIDEKTMFFKKQIVNPSGIGEIQGVTRLILPGESGKAKLKQLLDDNSVEFSSISTMPIPGVKVEFSILGISGFRMFQIFGVNNLPKPYDNVFFQITELKHSVTDAGWITRVTAAVRPRGSILSLI